MKDVTEKNFGLVIAYLLPGFLVVWGLSTTQPRLEALLFGLPNQGVYLGGFLYGTIAALFAGLTASTVRFFVIDAAFARLGIKPGQWDFQHFGAELAAYDALTQNQYRYYQFYANNVVALVFSYVAVRCSPKSSVLPWGLGELGLVVLCALYLLGARDTLTKYYGRLSILLEKEENHD